MNELGFKNSLKAEHALLPNVAPTATQTVMLYNPDGTPAGKYPARQLIQDMATAGTAYGTCSTAAKTAAKTVTISDFILLKGGIISVYFTSGIDVADATLNVSSTGAKPIRAMGAALQPRLVKAQTVVQLQYDGTAWNIVGMFGLEQSQAPDALTVDLGLPSGVLWAKASIDLTTPSKLQEVDGAVSPFKYDCSFFSWGNTDGHNPISTSAFDYNWGGINSEDPPYDGQVYGDTPGSKITANIAPSMDCVRANLGAPWRMPIKEEFQELSNNCDFIDANGTVLASTLTDKRVTVNGVLGIYWQSKINGNRIFFPCSGYGAGTSWYGRGSYGLFWSASFNSMRNARSLYFNSGGVSPQSYDNRCSGFPVRPVQ